MNIIYKHTSKTSSKSYIGKTSKTLEVRLNEHTFQALNGGTGHFKNAIRKYGIDDFSSEILEENISNDQVNEREIYWISHYDTYNNGYNMTIGGEGTSGYKQTDEHKAKTRAKNLGLKRTDEQRKNISEAHKGQVAWNKGISTDTSHLGDVQCPFCLKVGRLGPMKQWHFNYCKENPERLFRKKRVMSDEGKKKKSEKAKSLGKIECPNCSKLVGVQGKTSHLKKCLKETEKENE